MNPIALLDYPDVALPPLPKNHLSGLGFHLAERLGGSLQPQPAAYSGDPERFGAARIHFAETVSMERIRDEMLAYFTLKGEYHDDLDISPHPLTRAMWIWGDWGSEEAGGGFGIAAIYEDDSLTHLHVGLYSSI